MSKVERMGKTEFYRFAAEELREAGCERVFEELKGELRGSRGVRPADAVAIWNGAIIVTEMKSPREMQMLPLGVASGLLNEHLTETRRTLSDEVKKGELSRLTARHLLYLAQAEHYVHTFAAGAWTVSTMEELAWANPGLSVGYCIPAEAEAGLMDALNCKAVGQFILLRGTLSLTLVYTLEPDWQPGWQLPLFLRGRSSRA